MDIKDIFLYPDNEVHEVVFPERDFSIKKRCFLRIEKAKKLFEIGLRINNCLTSVKKVKFYCHAILNCDLELYIIKKNGSEVLAAIRRGEKLVEHHIINTGEGDILNYIKNCLKPRLKNRNRLQLALEIKKKSHWKKYIFSGTKEDLFYKNILYISYVDKGDSRFLICSKPDQINNKLHKVKTLKKIKNQTFISDSSLDGSDDSLCMYTFNRHSLKCEDINDDPVVTFSVRGVYIK